MAAFRAPLLTLALAVVWLSGAFASELRQPAEFIVNGVSTQPGRYKYYTSLRYKLESNVRDTGFFKHYCGASLIADRLVLTAAHCVMIQPLLKYYDDAQPADFREAGLNFTQYPNAYVVGGGLQYSAFVGATDKEVGFDKGNEIAMWFVHPWYDKNSLFYDMAVGLLTNSLPNATKAQIFSGAEDIYSMISSDARVTAIGLGNYINDGLSEILTGLNYTTTDLNDDPVHPLEETDIGRLVPRTLCGKAITAAEQTPSKHGNGNFQYGSPATVIGPGQFCVGPADNAEIDQHTHALAYNISHGTLPPSLEQELEEEGIDPSNPDDIMELMNGYNDTCQGDSGGPIFLKGSDDRSDIQIGTVSYGIGCGAGIAGVYTNIQAYLNSTLFDNFLRNLLVSVPNTSNSNPNATLVQTLPSNIASAG